MLYDDDEVLHVTLARAPGVSLGENVQFSQSAVTRVVEGAQAIHMIDIGPPWQSILDCQPLTVMCVPLRVKDRMIGLLYVDANGNKKEFNDRDLHRLKALAAGAAKEIERWRRWGDRGL